MAVKLYLQNQTDVGQRAVVCQFWLKETFALDLHFQNSHFDHCYTRG